MSKVEQKSRKNYAKRDSYALAFRMIDNAIKYDCPLQAITIEESILADRLWSTLNVGRGKRKLGTLNQALNEWMKRDDEPHDPHIRWFDSEMAGLYPRLKKWWGIRNELLHGIAKSWQGEGPAKDAEVFLLEAMTAAREGLVLANKVKNWTQKQIRRSARTNKSMLKGESR